MGNGIYLVRLLSEGILQPGDANRLVCNALQDKRLGYVANEFNCSPVIMAGICLDAGLVFLAACLLAPAGTLLSPPPVADIGWDAMADHERNPTEKDYYEQFCNRLATYLGVTARVPVHTVLCPDEAEMITHNGSAAVLLGLITRHNLPYDEQYWPLSMGSGSKCGDHNGHNNRPRCAAPQVPPPEPKKALLS